MYVCVYVCMYVCVYVCVYLYVYIVLCSFFFFIPKIYSFPSLSALKNKRYVVSTAQDDVIGNGADWIQEHLATSYEPAWSNPVINQYPGSSETAHLPPLTAWVDHANEQDAAIKVKALSRWNNYYVEGIRQMIDDFGYDGLYLDEIAYDRITMLRAKKMLGAERLIDHHSDQGGFTSSPSSNYLEL